MEDTAKYLVHADLVADGVVERSDVVGAVFGQTEGLLGDHLDIRDLQESSRLGRIDVSVESEAGQSYGRITVASSMDRVETAILAATLEAIERVGPCHADVEVTRIEDVRAAKRRQVVDRAKELLATSFDDGVLEGDDVVEEVRESVRVEDITEYEGLPAGPHVATSDAVVVVEGRSDVKRLLRYGIKNAVAVEGTNVPEAVAELTRERTTTAFLDGDRGGHLILRELAQVGDVDYVARPPAETSVEDLDRRDVHRALRQKAPFDPSFLDADPEGDADAATAATDGSAQPAPSAGEAAGASPKTDAETTDDAETADGAGPSDAPRTTGSTGTADATGTTGTSAASGRTEASETAEDAASGPETPETRSLADAVAAVADSGEARFLDATLDVVGEHAADEAFDALADGDVVPTTVVLDAPVTQRLLDVSAQRGVGTVIGSERGDFVKQPAAVRVHTFSDVESGTHD